MVNSVTVKPLNSKVAGLEKTTTAYKNVLKIFDTVERMCSDVHFEILVERQAPENGVIESIMIRPEVLSSLSEEGSCQEAKPATVALRERFEDFKRTKEDYKILLKKAIETKVQIHKKYKGKNYKISLVKRKTSPESTTEEAEREAK